MKKTYITPLMSVENIEMEQMLAASRFNIDSNSQSITLSDEEYDGEFCSKDNPFDTDLFE